MVNASLFNDIGQNKRLSDGLLLARTLEMIWG
jgi:hypothetical protein